MFTMPTEKLAAVAEIGMTDTATVQRVALEYDWANAEDHQAWLDSAEPHAIACWLACILKDEASDA